MGQHDRAGAPGAFRLLQRPVAISQRALGALGALGVKKPPPHTSKVRARLRGAQSVEAPELQRRGAAAADVAEPDARLEAFQAAATDGAVAAVLISALPFQGGTWLAARVLAFPRSVTYVSVS